MKHLDLIKKLGLDPKHIDIQYNSYGCSCCDTTASLDITDAIEKNWAEDCWINYQKAEEFIDYLNTNHADVLLKYIAEKEAKELAAIQKPKRKVRKSKTK